MISEFPLLIFTVFVGIPCGAYALRPFFGKIDNVRNRAWVFPLICLVLLGIGLLGTLLHLNHPERVLNAMSNPGAMITQEAYWSSLFGLMVFVDLVCAWLARNTPRAIQYIAVAAAVILMIVTGMAYANAHNIAAWDGPATYLFFIGGDLAMGIGLLTLFNGELFSNKTFAKCALIVLIVAGALHLLEALQFGIAGSLNAIAIVIGALLQLAAIPVLQKATKGSFDARKAAWLLLALAFVGVVVARYAFYAACVF